MRAKTQIRHVRVSCVAATIRDAMIDPGMEKRHFENVISSVNPVVNCQKMVVEQKH
jgi:hypothetical protein